MFNHVNVNGVKIPVVHHIRIDKLMGIERGNVLIVAHSCHIPENVQRYLESRDTKIIRLD